MPIDFRERWKKLCEEAEAEDDSEKLVELVRAFNRELESQELPAHAEIFDPEKTTVH
jgi:hypothetical protein